MSTSTAQQSDFRRQPRVLMFCSDTLVGAAVRLALERQGIELLGVESDTVRGLATVEALLPDVVLMEGAGWGAEFMSAVWNVLNQRTGAQVIVINSDDNRILISHQEQRLLGSARELAQIIFDSTREKN
jgi:chemotaxis response regulator CheB